MVISGITVEIGLVMMTSLIFSKYHYRSGAGRFETAQRDRGLISLSGVVFVALPTLIGVCSRNAPTE